ncbi:MAG: lysylphosphatidylglycerol synthase transmembrane domain-containing protein [Chloroflexota bacterium]
MKARLASFRPLIGLALTVLFLVLALQRVDLNGFVEEMRRVNYIWLLPSAACTLVGYVLRTVRWRVILSGAARAPLSTLFPVLIMGFATNNLLPGRLGEFWRAYLLGRKRSVSKTFALASVVAERVFDGLTLIALLAVVSVAIKLPGWGVQAETIAVAVFLGATLMLAALLFFPGVVATPMAWGLRPLPGPARRAIEARVFSFISGLAPLREGRVLLAATALSLAVWAFEASSYVLLSRGVSLELPQSSELSALGLTLVTINLGIMVPSGPGYVGTQEFFGTAALGVVGANPQAALALIVVSHAVQYVLVTGLGLLFFAREHLSPQDLRPALAEQQASS